MTGTDAHRPITEERFEAIRTDGRARRICFAGSHADQPRRRGEPPYVGTLKLPFLNGVVRVLRHDCRIAAAGRKNQDGSWWWQLRSDDEFEQVATWARSLGNLVFLRDCLEISIALDLNIVVGPDGTEGHTRLGALESRAKRGPDEAAIGELLAEMSSVIARLPGYRAATLIAAVPPRPGKTHDLPSVLAARIAGMRSMTDLTSRFRFAGEKRTVKAARIEDKWPEWEKSGLSFAPALVGHPSVILVDDKYQSGTTLQFVASVLRAAGAGDIYGLCAVKTLRDTDNA